MEDRHIEESNDIMQAEEETQAEGGAVFDDMWSFLWGRWLGILPKLDLMTTQEQDIQQTSQYITKIFYHGLLGHHTLDLNSFLDPKKEQSLEEKWVAIEAYIRKAGPFEDSEHDYTQYMNEIFSNQGRLLIPTARIAIEEWLRCKSTIEEIWFKFAVARKCLGKVSLNSSEIKILQNFLTRPSG